jgi:hypothetical protein
LFWVEIINVLFFQIIRFSSEKPITGVFHLHKLFHAKHFTGHTTKYIYIKSTTVYVPSSELGLSHPLSPRNQREAHSPGGKGSGESQFRRLDKRLALCLLCGSYRLTYRTTQDVTIFVNYRVSLLTNDSLIKKNIYPKLKNLEKLHSVRKLDK